MDSSAITVLFPSPLPVMLASAYWLEGKHTLLLRTVAFVVLVFRSGTVMACFVCTTAAPAPHFTDHGMHTPFVRTRAVVWSTAPHGVVSWPRFAWSHSSNWHSSRTPQHW